MPSPPCIVCGARKWLRLPDPSPNRSVTTAGCIVDEALGKSQCVNCGLIQRNECRYLGLTDFYENRYNTYYERPGTQTFNGQRYAKMAQWVSSSIGNFTPESVIEVGCGRGWALREIKKIYPYANIEGIEPSIANCAETRKLGFLAYNRKLDSNNLPEKRYDLIFSNHVLQHTTDPHGFLQAMGKMVSRRGVIVITVQDASLTSNELLYSDQNFSFLPAHLTRLAEGAGLRILSWKKAPDDDALRFSQLLVCAKEEHIGHGSLDGHDVPETDYGFLEELYKRRLHYFEAWTRIADFLHWKTSKHRKIYNFGAGMYSYLLACYCAEYWHRVTSCILDNISGEFMWKPVVPIEKLHPGDGDCVVIGTRPGIQGMLAARIEVIGWEVIRWDNFVNG